VAQWGWFSREALEGVCGIKRGSFEVQKVILTCRCDKFVRLFLHRKGIGSTNMLYVSVVDLVGWLGVGLESTRQNVITFLG